MPEMFVMVSLETKNSYSSSSAVGLDVWEAFSPGSMASGHPLC